MKHCVTMALSRVAKNIVTLKSRSGQSI